MAYDIKIIGRTVNHFFWTLVLQGIIFVVLGVLIIIYPALLFALVSVFCVVIGVSLLVLAGKVREVWRSLPRILQ